MKWDLVGQVGHGISIPLSFWYPTHLGLTVYEQYSRVYFRCATADFISFAKELKDVDTSNFYTEFKMAEVRLEPK